MNENLATFLYELANFVVFAMLLGWFFLKPIRKLLDEQATNDAKLERSAREHLDEAEKMRLQLLTDRQRFNRDMELQRQAVVTEAKQEAAKLLESTNQKI